MSMETYEEILKKLMPPKRNGMNIRSHTMMITQLSLKANNIRSILNGVT